MGFFDDLSEYTELDQIDHEMYVNSEYIREESERHKSNNSLFDYDNSYISSRISDDNYYTSHYESKYTHKTEAESNRQEEFKKYLTKDIYSEKKSYIVSDITSCFVAMAVELIIPLILLKCGVSIIAIPLILIIVVCNVVFAKEAINKLKKLNEEAEQTLKKDDIDDTNHNLRKKRIKILIIIAIIIFLLSTNLWLPDLVLNITNYFKCEKDYKIAIQIFESGDYGQAFYKFTMVEVYNYKDKDSYTQLCIAEREYQKKNYSSAHNLVSHIYNVDDSFRYATEKQKEKISELLSEIKSSYNNYAEVSERDEYTGTTIYTFPSTTKKETTTKKKSYFHIRSSSSKNKSDPYHIKEYCDPEEFYDDYYNDFDDYEEAEDYYYDHGGW